MARDAPRGLRYPAARLKYRIAGAIAIVAFAAVAAWWLLSSVPRGEGPPRGASRHVAPPVELSTIALPIAIGHADLTRSLEERIPEVLVDEEGEEIREGWLADIHAERPTPPVARGEDGKLVIEVPLEVAIKVYRAKKAERRAAKDKGAPQGLGVKFSAVIEIAVDFEVTEDWRLVAESELSHRWVERPKLEIGPFKFNVTKIVDKALATQFEEVGRNVDERLKEEDRLRQGIEKAWANLGTSRQVNADPPTWFISEPTAMFASDLEVTDDALEITVGVRGRFATVVGDPGPAKPVPPLPPRGEAPDKAGLFIAVPVSLGWDPLSAAADADLSGQSWELSGGSLTVTGIELYPSGEALVVALDYRAESAWSTDGTLYLMGTPVLDTANRRLEVEDFDYVLDTWDVAIAGSNVLLESGIEEAVRTRLSYDFGPELEAARKRANAQLASQETEGGVFTGKLDAIQVRGLYLTNDALIVDAAASGSASMQITELKN